MRPMCGSTRIYHLSVYVQREKREGRESEKIERRGGREEIDREIGRKRIK